MKADRGRTLPSTAATVVLAVALALSAAPARLGSGPRPPVSTWTAPGNRTSPPTPHADQRFTTLPFETMDGVPGTWQLTADHLPLRLLIEQEVVDRFGLDRLRDALTVWNGTDGSRFGVSVIATTREGLDGRRQDGVNRVFLDRRTCGERFLARAHLYPANIEQRGTSSVAWVEEVDIGICERLRPDRLELVLRHELAHVAGLGHLCDESDPCWTPDLSPDNRCRVMSPASHLCQEITAGDLDGLVRQHPVVPRLRADTPVESTALESFLSYPRVRGAPLVLASAEDASPDLQAAAGALAAVLDAPHLVVDEGCTSGPDGRELNRVAMAGAHVLLVGPVGRSCERALTGDWELTTERLDDLVDVALRTARENADTVVVVPRTTGHRMPVAALAAPLVATMRAPLVVTDPAELDDRAVEILDRFPEAARAIVLGGPIAVRSAVTDALADRGLHVRRIAANGTYPLAVRVSRTVEVYGAGPVDFVIAALGRPGAATAAATLAARRRAAVLPYEPRTAALMLDTLEARARTAIVTGSLEAVPEDVQVAASRRVDHG